MPVTRIFTFFNKSKVNVRYISCTKNIPFSVKTLALLHQYAKEVIVAAKDVIVALTKITHFVAVHQFIKNTEIELNLKII